jgi:uncharacterized protein (DUF305 family)
LCSQIGRFAGWRLPVEEAEVMFLNLMIRHHQGGIEIG